MGAYFVFRNKHNILTLTPFKLGLLCVTLPGLISANNTTIHLITSPDTKTVLQLEVTQAPLSQVLTKVSEMIRIPIHYSVLPEGLITTTCVGASLQQIMACLLDHKADVIFRYSDNTLGKSQNGNIKEAWVLGAKFDAIAPTITSATCEARVLKQQEQSQATIRNKTDEIQAETEEVNNLIEMAQSKNPAERAEGIGGLLAADKPGDLAIRATLKAALSDKNPEVRAQAISSFAHREGANAAAELQTALQDSSAEVRIMAVDSAGGNTILLQQALHDSDETVRSLAALKLEILNEGNAR